MLFIPLLRKEVHWSKRNILVLGFLLLLVPAAFGLTSIAFQQTVPENVPVALVAQNENVTEDDVGNVNSFLVTVADPVVVDSEGDPASNREKAIKMMEREEVYLIIEVPPNIAEGGPQVNETFRFIVDGNIAPLQDARPFLEDIVQNRLSGDSSGAVEGNFTIESEAIGLDHVDEERSLAEFLYPTFMMAMLIFFAFTYVPYSLSRDGSVLDRLRVETSLESLVASKLVFLTALMAVTVVSRFSGTGQFVNLLLMLGVLGGSAIDFPRGVVSALRPTIAELTPVHWGMVAIRSLMLKNVSVGMYTDMILTLVGLQVLGLIALQGSIIYFRRTT